MEPGLLPRFFERVTRQVWSDLALDDQPAARYVTNVLTRFARMDALYAVDGLPGRRLETVAESLLEIQRAWDIDSPGFDPGQENAVRRHIGDVTLFMTGIFREHIERLAMAGYYEDQGRRAYRFVSEIARAAGQPDAPLFRRLSEHFERYSGALSYMRKVYFRAERLPWPALPDDPFFRRLVTG